MAEDRHLRLRAITLRFFESSLATLALIRKDHEEFPGDREARRRWVREIREFADRAQALATKWEREIPEAARHAHDGMLESPLENLLETPTPLP